jgi:LysM repeat protein
MYRLALVLVIVMLIASGCNRPASEGAISLSSPTPAGGQPLVASPIAITPIPPTDVVPTLPLPTDVVPTLAAQSIDPTATVPFVAPNTLPTADMGGVTLIAPTVPPTNTLPAMVPTTLPTLDSGGSIQPATLVYITPPVAIPVTVIAPTSVPITDSGAGGILPTSTGGAFTSTPSGLITPTALANPNASGDGCTYTVQTGNTLFRIALSNNITLEQLRDANPALRGDLIQPGQTLTIPGCGAGLDAGGNPVPTSTLAATATAVEAQTTHTVAAGETLIAIARRYGVTVQAIVSANNLQNPNLLTPGQTLIIPSTSR